MGNNGARADREMQALIRKMQKKRKKLHPELGVEDAAVRGTRYIDRAGMQDRRVEDATADEIFREMKRRDF